MTTKDEIRDLTGIPLDPGYNSITVTSESETVGLGESDESTPVSYSINGKLDIRLSDDGSYAIVYGIGTYDTYAIVLPSDYNGVPVEEIANSAFELSNLQSIVIPYTVKRIGEYAFYRSSSLSSVTFESKEDFDNDLIIEMQAFAGTKLSSIKIPRRVTIIGASAFSISTLNNLIFEDNSRLETIGKGAFLGTAISSVSLPSKLKKIGEQAFHSCSQLTNITIPSSVEFIGARAFLKSGLFNAFFDDPNVWFASSTEILGEGESHHLDASQQLGSPVYAAYILTMTTSESTNELKYYANYHLHKIKKMIPPIVTLVPDTTFLSMVDPLGVADMFNIYSNGKLRATIYTDDSIEDESYPDDTGSDPDDTGSDPDDTGSDPDDTGSDPDDTGTDSAPDES